MIKVRLKVLTLIFKYKNLSQLFCKYNRLTSLPQFPKLEQCEANNLCTTIKLKKDDEEKMRHFFNLHNLN